MNNLQLGLAKCSKIIGLIFEALINYITVYWFKLMLMMMLLVLTGLVGPAVQDSRLVEGQNNLKLTQCIIPFGVRSKIWLCIKLPLAWMLSC